MADFLMNRRQVLTGVAAAGVAVAAGAPAHAAGASAHAASAPVTGGPFGLGVASGDPLPDGVILWTRLTGAANRRREVGWQVARDEGFRHVVRRGVTTAEPRRAHAVHVDARGLDSAREYFYRFRVGREVSPAGRTKTAPAPHADPGRLRFAVASCQDFQNGYWPAYHGLADEDVDVILHLGDYIYEYDPGSRFADRLHTTPDTPGLDQLSTLDDYRARHAQYKSDPALQAAHAAAPWVVTWDDHETENNYAGVVDEIDDTGAKHQTPEEFTRQRAAAYQAYFEHMPIRVHGTRIYRRFDYGRLLRLNVLDTRQHRTDQPGGFPNDFGPEAAGRANAGGTMTGDAQERWLTDGLTNTRARWNVIAQQTMMSRTRFPIPAVNLDQWDGYAPQRERLLRFLASRGTPNPVVLAGDIHSTWFSELRPNFDDPTTEPVAVEFVGTSISSDFPVAFDGPIKQANPVLNPHVRYFDGLKRGYLRCEVGRDAWHTDVRVVDTIETRQAPTRTDVSFVVEAGRSRLTKA